MAGLPPDGQWLMQQNDGVVTLFHRETQEEVVAFNPADPSSFGPALKTIWEDARFGDEQKCFAAFWAGYFHGYS